jgi:hypothetical protein
LEEAFQMLKKTAVDPDVLKSIGKQPMPPEMGEAPTEISMATRYNFDRRAWIRDIANSHMVRHHPDWAQYVEDDYSFNCEIITSLEKINWRCVGWDCSIEQVKFSRVDTTLFFSNSRRKVHRTICDCVFHLHIEKRR